MAISLLRETIISSVVGTFAHTQEIYELIAKYTFALLRTVQRNGFFVQCILHVHLCQMASEKRVHLLK